MHVLCLEGYGAGFQLYYAPVPKLTCSHAGEDDGYLVLFVYDEGTQSSDFVVYNAKSFSSKPVATVKLPQRVPYGFHGKHVNAAEFQSQFPFDIHFLPDL